MSNEFQDEELDFGDGAEAAEVEQAEVEQVAVNEDNTTPAEATEAQADKPAEVAASTEPEKSDEEKAAEAEAKAAAEAEELRAAVETFQSAVADALGHEGRDAGTGVLPEVAFTPVITAYAALPGAKGKSAGRNFLADKMQESMFGNDFQAARSYLELTNKLKAEKISATPRETIVRVKVDPTVAFVDQMTALMLAVNLVPVPADVKENWAELAEDKAVKLEEDTVKYAEWLATDQSTDAPEVDAVVVAAGRIAQGRVTKPRKPSTGASTPRVASDGPRGDVGIHIREALNSVQVGEFMSISQMSNAVTSEYGGDKKPVSAGAIAARLFPQGDASKCKLDFARPEGKDEGHPVKGAVRLS